MLCKVNQRTIFANGNPAISVMLICRQWIRDSWDHYSRLAHSTEAKDAGCQFISGYQYYNDDDKVVC